MFEKAPKGTTTKKGSANNGEVTVIKDVHGLSNPLHCRLVGSHLVEEMQWSAASIESIRDYILMRVLNKMSAEKADSFVYGCRDAVFDLMVKKVHEKM